MSKESFKLFVKNNPSLANFTRNGDMTWQSFYELYDLYGESSSVWNKYLNSGISGESTSLLGDTSLKEIFNVVKKIDLDTVKKGVDGLQKAVGLVQDISANRKTSSSASSSTYQARPMYRYFDD